MPLTLPILGQAEPLDPRLVEKCEAGECTQCGLCCMVYRVEVPSVRGDITSPLQMKMPGEPCPQLRQDMRGRYECVLQREKESGDPRLQACREWNGGAHRVIQLSALTERAILYPTSKEAVLMLQDLIRRGLANIFAFEVQPENVANLVLRYIRLGSFPVEIFSALGVKSMLRQLEEHSPNAYEELDNAIWMESEELYRMFSEFMGDTKRDCPDPSLFAAYATP